MHAFYVVVGAERDNEEKRSDRADFVRLQRAAVIGDNESAVTSIVKATGRALPSTHDPGHPEDERHYYVVPEAGLQLLQAADGTVAVLFFMLVGDTIVRGYPWVLNRVIDGHSTRDMVRAHLGKPEASGEAKTVMGMRLESWDRFAYPPFGYLRSQYSEASGRLSQLTAMTVAATPRRG